jgi:ferredoxin-NADP reductase
MKAKGPCNNVAAVGRAVAADRRPRRVLRLGVHGHGRDATPRTSASVITSRLVHVLGQPPGGWTGETGRITPAMLDRHVPAAAARHYFVCGPPPMMDTVERHLLARGVPMRHIHSERFNLA